MKELIRKILREGEDLERIQKNEKETPKIVPRIVSYIKEKYGRGVKVKVGNKKIYFGSDAYQGSCKEINVYVEDESLNASEIKFQLWNDFKNFFGVDMREYGTCLFLTVYKKNWERI
jgi:hypothetical protein